VSTFCDAVICPFWSCFTKSNPDFWISFIQCLTKFIVSCLHCHLAFKMIYFVFITEAHQHFYFLLTWSSPIFLFFADMKVCWWIVVNLTHCSPSCSGKNIAPVAISLLQHATWQSLANVMSQLRVTNDVTHLCFHFNDRTSESNVMKAMLLATKSQTSTFVKKFSCQRLGCFGLIWSQC